MALGLPGRGTTRPGPLLDAARHGPSFDRGSLEWQCRVLALPLTATRSGTSILHLARTDQLKHESYTLVEAMRAGLLQPVLNGEDQGA